MTTEELRTIEKLLAEGYDLRISKMHEHCSFGFANKFCVSVRRGYELPRRVHADTIMGAVAMICSRVDAQEPPHTTSPQEVEQ